MVCTICGKGLQSNATFCTNCGATVSVKKPAAEQKIQEQKRMCRNCFTPLEEGTICPVCGFNNASIDRTANSSLAAPPHARAIMPAIQQKSSMPEQLDFPPVEQVVFPLQPVKQELIKQPPVTGSPKEETEKAPKVQSNQRRKTYSSRVLERGRVTIPKQIREALNLDKDQYVTFSIENGRVLFAKSREKKGD